VSRAAVHRAVADSPEHQQLLHAATATSSTQAVVTHAAVQHPRIAPATNRAGATSSGPTGSASRGMGVVNNATSINTGLTSETTTPLLNTLGYGASNGATNVRRTPGVTTTFGTGSGFSTPGSPVSSQLSKAGTASGFGSDVSGLGSFGTMLFGGAAPGVASGFGEDVTGVDGFGDLG
jgi:hypothetical protein